MNSWNPLPSFVFSWQQVPCPRQPAAQQNRECTHYTRIKTGKQEELWCGYVVFVLFCRTNDKKRRKNVFVENIDVHEWRTIMKTSKFYLLIQRIFLKSPQKVILFCRKRLTIWYVSAIIICVARATGTAEYADVAELADALDSGSSSLKRVWVQIPSSAPKKST